MDLGLAFSYPFEDQEWAKKLAIAAALLFIPILGWLLVFGWGLEITRRVIRQSDEVLPDWTQFENLFVLGIKGFVIAFVYSLPITLFSVPIYVFGWFEDLQNVVAVFAICLSCFSVLYSFVLALILPASFGILGVSDDLGEALNPRKIFNLLQAAPGAYIITFVGSLIANFVSGIGVVACFVGILFTSAYSIAFLGHLVGQAYNQATAAT